MRMERERERIGLVINDLLTLLSRQERATHPPGAGPPGGGGGRDPEGEGRLCVLCRLCACAPPNATDPISNRHKEAFTIICIYHTGGFGLLLGTVAARFAFCILFCVTPFISMNGMKPAHITKKARATAGTFAGKYLRCTAKPAPQPPTPAAAAASELYRSKSPRCEACARALYGRRCR